jgi:plastocyanin
LSIPAELLRRGRGAKGITRTPEGCRFVQGEAARRVWDDKTKALGKAENLVADNAMSPQHLHVPIGTKVTFVNPANNRQAHGAVSFWELEFHTGMLLPGQASSHTFAECGEFFYNDPAYPQSTGKIVVF